MAANKRFIHFKEKSKFNEELEAGNISDDSIVFIKDSKEIYTHNQTYGGDIEELIKDKANISDLSNVVAKEVVDNVEDLNVLTREDLKKDLFIDLWNKACTTYGKYNYETGYFELNGLTDITYEEALQIYSKKLDGGVWSGMFTNSTLRTNLVVHFPYSPSSTISLNRCFQGCVNLKYARIIAPTILGDMTFYNCKELETILGENDIAGTPVGSTCLQNCSKLKNFKFNRLRGNSYFKDCPLITIESFEYTVQKALTSSTPYNIYVHQDIYNALLGQDTEYPFNGGTREEWLKLNEDALAKQITFATI